ncbi:MAG: acyl carrier protein [Alphaproteobacteria bacterium]|jgi:acyl carrier protein
MAVVREDVIAAVREADIVSDPDALRDDMPLTDQGVDSLGLFNIILLLQEKYDLEIPDADIDAMDTIQAIIDYLNGRLA